MWWSVKWAIVQVPLFTPQDVLDILWARDNAEMFAMVEKARLYICRGSDIEDPRPNRGYLCDFADLEVRWLVRIGRATGRKQSQI